MLLTVYYNLGLGVCFMVCDFNQEHGNNINNEIKSNEHHLLPPISDGRSSGGSRRRTAAADRLWLLNHKTKNKERDGERKRDREDEEELPAGKTQPSCQFVSTVAGTPSSDTVRLNRAHTRPHGAISVLLMRVS